MWSIVMEPGKKYSTVVEKTFHLSMATLDLESVKNADDVHTVYVETDDNPRVILCHLSKASKLYQCRLDHIFPRGTYLKFVTSATANIHMTGYLDLNEGDELYSDLESKSDEEGTEIEKPVQEKGNKRKSEDNVSKKNKSIKFDESNQSDEDTDDENDSDEIMDFEDDSEDDGIKLTIMAVDDSPVEELNVCGESPEQEVTLMAVGPETTSSSSDDAYSDEDEDEDDDSAVENFSGHEDAEDDPAVDRSGEVVKSTGSSVDETPYKFKCDKCQLSFKNKCWFNRHLGTHSEATFACNFCPKLYKRKDTLQEHQKLHLVGGKKHKCEECNKTFSDKRNLNAHVKLKHRNSLVKCPKCDKTYSGTRQLRYHDNRMHSLNKPYTCTVCKESFAVPCLLATHRKKHNL